jgi:hypothetical protein
MLIPNKDFTQLHCSNPKCNKKYLFEDIRRKIGNDIHKHEIGDLTEEGYVMKESNVLTELTLNRSNYLAKSKKKEDKSAKVEKIKIQPKRFVMDKPPSEYL